MLFIFKILIATLGGSSLFISDVFTLGVALVACIEVHCSPCLTNNTQVFYSS